MNKLTSIVRQLRVEQWLKNLFVFIPLFFSGEFNQSEKLYKAVLTFICFCFVSSSVYIVNDLRDLETDRKHPTKSKRPMASGQISIGGGVALGFIVLFFGIWMLYVIHDPLFVGIVAGYLMLNLTYSFGLKNVSILDILIISSGFVLRTISGAVVTNVFISQWMVVMIFLLALFLALAKRRDDLVVFLNSGDSIRKSIKNYNIEFVNGLLIMLSGIVIVSYLMYVISPEVMERFQSQHLYLTSFFVIAGMMRYMQIAMVENKSGSPTRTLYSDNFIRLVVLGWVLAFYLIIYKF